MPAWGIALGALICVEVAYGLSINNLEASFPAAVAIAAVTWIVAYLHEAARNGRLENPLPEPYRLRFGKTYGTVKEVLATCYDQPDGWKIAFDRSDKGFGRLEAYIVVRDDSWREHKILVPQRTISKRVNVDIGVTPGKGGSTTVDMNFRVDCPFPATRGDLNQIIEHTTQEIKAALEHAEVEKHG